MIRLLCIGDIVGRAGRDVLKTELPRLQRQHNADATVVNLENAAAGFGITDKVYNELNALDIHCFTSGNHIFDKREIIKTFHEYTNLIRPYNYPNGTPGNGYYSFKIQDTRVTVINLIGRVFMNHADCPFQKIDALLDTLSNESDVIVVDFHAEATSEKLAMGWHLSNRVSLVYGSHTHVQTADQRLLNQHTAYISDIGMTGAYNGILGMEKDSIVQKFID